MFGKEPSDASLQKSADSSWQAPSLRSPSGQTATDWTSDPGGASGENVHPFAATKFFSSIGFEESLLLYEVRDAFRLAVMLYDIVAWCTLVPLGSDIGISMRRRRLQRSCTWPLETSSFVR